MTAYPLTVWKCEKCGTEIKWQTTSSTVDVTIDFPSCGCCGGNMRIVKLGDIEVDGGAA